MSSRVFVCFDARSDVDLCTRFSDQCGAPASGLDVVDHSRVDEPHAGWESRLRGRLSRADVVVVLCGVHTDDAANVNRELSIAQQEGKPYVLIWGRRSEMCTRPLGAKANDLFYAWIWEILTAQIQSTLRKQDEATDRDLGGFRGPLVSRAKTGTSAAKP
jgi:antiphage defense system Thoeris ThsB-like protein